jgi:predicted glycoside hydrolase/deacetylase ChbG (UPF0249 family)
MAPPSTGGDETPALTVVLPAYDEARHLAENLRRLIRHLDREEMAFEVVVVDDGSRDGTGDAAEEVARDDARVRVLRHVANRGKGAALATGCLAARGDVIVLLDADLEIPPEEVPPLLALLRRTGADVAVGSKYHPEARLVWPWRRRVLSRLYHFVTAILFRLPLRDTQTGLKAIRRSAARELVPRLTSRRFAWDVELLLLAHRTGRRSVAGPVHLAPSSRASRVTPRAALLSGLDTFRIFLRDRGLGAYRLRAGRRRGGTRVIVHGDDLGMSPAVNRGLAQGLAEGGLTSCSVLVDAPGAIDGLRAVGGRSVDLGLHLDLLDGRGLARFALQSAFSRASLRSVELETQRQLARLRAAGVAPTHVDAHRHAWLAPRVRRAVARVAAREGVAHLRSLRPLGPLFASGVVEGLKRTLLWTLSLTGAGIARAHGLASPDGHVDAQEAARWVRRGRIPRYARGRVVEVIAHPLHGASDLPSSEERTLDRLAEGRAVLEPPLADALRALGAHVSGYPEALRR